MKGIDVTRKVIAAPRDYRAMKSWGLAPRRRSAGLRPRLESLEGRRLLTVPTSTILAISPTGPQFYGTTPTMTATVGVRLGTVEFDNGTTVLGDATLNSSGVATLATAALPIGIDSVTATFEGAGFARKSTSSPVMETIVATSNVPTATTVSSQAAAPVYGQANAITATVVATSETTAPTGIV